jgi:hypothetical protein
MSGPSLHIGLPPRELFKLPPDPAPPAIPPPFESPSLRTPHPIPADIFNAVLQPVVPLTIAAVYATTVLLTNAYNRRRGWKPWRISKTRLFKVFVIVHNVFLAVYSAVTCVAMFNALKRTLPHFSEPHSLVGTVDALCKMHGPRGLGDAVTYNTTTAAWQADNTAIHLGPQGLPDSTDVGRLWNEGLAFWGWWFYLSKFYEVLDTFIILAKGKRSSTLQTYHHTGAMMCMWAGMRYMSAPIWIFVLFNSAIHAMMYTYYTLSALGFRVPQRVKRSLTTLQITQFVFGASFAALPLFLSYTFPVSVAYVTSELVAAPASTVAAVLSSDSASSAISAVSTAGATALLKKLIYRAAGEEGLAENVPTPAAGAHDIQNAPELQQVINQAIKKVFYRTQYKGTQCIDTTGRSFAIWLNLVYLFPLTMLFVRFFIKSYTRRSSSSAKHPTKQNRITKAGMDAVHGVEREMESLTEAPGNVLNGTPSAPGTPTESKQDGRGRGRDWEFNPVSDSAVDRQQQLVEAFNKKVSDGLEKAKLNGKATAQAAKEIAEDIMSRASTPKGKRTRDVSSHKAQEPEKANKTDDATAPKVEEPENVVADTKIEPLEDQSASIEGFLAVKPEPSEEEGLSTTDPKEAGIAYADMVKK